MARSGFQRQLNRIMPRLPAGAMKTYAISAPTATHWRPATCAEVGCEPYTGGWRTSVDEASELGRRQAHYIRKQSGRSFTEQREGALTIFTFEPGQACFASSGHKAPLGRPELFSVRGGDWRGATGERRVHKRAEDWVDDFATHQQSLADRLARG